METLTVSLGENSYPIFIGAGVSKNVETLLPYLARPKVMIVSNDIVAPLYLDEFKQGLCRVRVGRV